MNLMVAPQDDSRISYQTASEIPCHDELLVRGEGVERAMMARAGT